MSNYDYSRIMMMKILLANPDNKGGSEVYCNFEQALVKIKTIDTLTKGIKKVIYLVGWQYLGHDDKYPAFFEVNDNLKRQEDNSARESLLWLVAEAKQYNAIISLHINISDAYSDSPLWKEYLDNNLIVTNLNGAPKVTGVWNGRKAYQICLQRELASGAFKRRVDKLFEVFPLSQVGTVHIDAFFVHNGANARIKQEKVARRQMADYFVKSGVDVTTEFIYRERNCGLRLHCGKSDCLDSFAAYWNPVVSARDILNYSSTEIAGGVVCNSLTMDKSLHYLIYGNMQGESILKAKEGWEGQFIKEFITYTVPYYYLNNHKRLAIKGIGQGRKLIHTNNIVSYIKDRKITQNDIELKINENLCLPISWQQSGYLAYNADGKLAKWQVTGEIATVYYYEGQQWTKVIEQAVVNNEIPSMDKIGAYYIECK